jgi:hypothetical protein
VRNPALQERAYSPFKSHTSQKYLTDPDRLIVCIRIGLSRLEVLVGIAIVLHLDEHEPEFALGIHLDVASCER